MPLTLSKQKGEAEKLYREQGSNYGACNNSHRLPVAGTVAVYHCTVTNPSAGGI